jgi:L-cysteine desulfidase
MDLYAFFQSEVKPTIGCTEPGAVAYAAAVAARHLPTQPEGIRLEMSVAIYKNGRPGDERPAGADAGVRARRARRQSRQGADGA